MTNRKKFFIYVFLSALMLATLYINNNKDFDSNEKIEHNSILGQLATNNASLNTDKPFLLTKEYNGVKYNQLNNYNIDVVLDIKNNVLNVKQEVRYYNSENIDLSEIYFHLYPNAYSKTKTAPTIFNSTLDAYPDGFSVGKIDIKSIKIQDSEVNYKISGNDRTILKIDLKNNLKRNDYVTIKFDYQVQIPCAKGRFGHYKGIYNLGNWYPIAAVYDENGWSIDPYYKLGDPFYSDISNYNITIHSPVDMKIASSGDIVGKEIDNDETVWHIKGDLRRDFAWIASENFVEKNEYVDGVLVKGYFLKDDNTVNSNAMKYAKNSIKVFSDTFGKYPYKTYSVVATNFPSGMEYPALVYINKEYYRKDRLSNLEIVIVHETGHQWWYSVIGSNQVDEAWLDESLTTYSEVIYFDELVGELKAEEYYKQIQLQYEFAKKNIMNKKVIRPLSEFKNWTDYGGLVYNRGAMFIHEIENRYSEKILYKILQNYYNKYKFKIATSSEFLSICRNHTDENFKKLTKIYLYNE